MPESSPRPVADGYAFVDVKKINTQQPAYSRLPSNRDSLLNMNPKDLEKDPKNLVELVVRLQTLCREQKAELDKLRQYELDHSKTAGSSRTPTQESDSTMKKSILQAQDTRRGIAIVLNPSNTKVKVVQRQGMRDSDYITADLPSFHWWQDCLHIYFPKDGEADASTKSQKKVLVRRRKFERGYGGDWDWFCSVKLAKLSPGIRFKRMFGIGGLNTLYVFAPKQELVQGIEMDAMKSMKSQQGTSVTPK